MLNYLLCSSRPHSEQIEPRDQVRKTKRAVSENTGLKHEDIKLNGDANPDEAVMLRRRRRMSSESTSTENGQDIEPPIVPVLRTTTSQQQQQQQNVGNSHHFIKNEQPQQQQKQKEESVIGAAIERKTPLTRDDIQKMNLKKKTRKRTRKFEIDGVVVTTTTSKVIYGDDENQRFYDEHYFRKQELRELKQLQKQEQKQFQDLVSLTLFLMALL
jgi:STE20-like kinase